MNRIDKDISVDDILEELELESEDKASDSSKNAIHDDEFLNNIINDLDRRSARNSIETKDQDFNNLGEKQADKVQLNESEKKISSKKFLKPSIDFFSKLNRNYTEFLERKKQKKLIKSGMKDVDEVEFEEFYKEEIEDDKGHKSPKIVVETKVKTGTTRVESDLEVEEILEDIAKKNTSKPEVVPKPISEFQKSRKEKMISFLKTLKGEKLNSEFDEEDLLEDDSVGYKYKQMDEYEDDANSTILTDSLKDLKSIKDLEKSFWSKFFILVVLFLVTGYMSVAGVYPEISFLKIIDKAANPFIFSAVNIICLVACIFICKTTIFEGIKSLIKFYPDKDTLVSFAVIFCFIQNYVCLFTSDFILNIHIYTPLGISILLFNVIGKLFIINRSIVNHRIISYIDEKSVLDIELDDRVSYGLTKNLEFSDAILASNKSVHYFEDFIEKAYGVDILDKIVKFIGPLAILISLICGAICYFKTEDMIQALSLFTSLLCVSAPLSLITSIHIPVWLVDRRLKKYCAGIVSISDIEDYGEVNCVLVDTYDMFLGSNVEINGIETFSGKRIDEAIVDAASVLCQSRSIFSGVFMNILLERKDLLKTIDSVVYEDKMGLSTWVDNKRVLIGTRELLINHGVKVPLRRPEDMYNGVNKTVLYLSTCGELTAIFTFTITPDISVEKRLKELESNDISVLIKTIDPVITLDFLTILFEVDSNIFKIIGSSQHSIYNECLENKKNISGTIVNNRTFDSNIISLVNAKKLKMTIIINVIILGTIIFGGIILFSIFGLIIGSAADISFLTILLYQVIWIPLSYLIANFRH